MLIQKIILKKGKGAQIGLVLDRSASMDDPFVQEVITINLLVKQNQLQQVGLLLIFLIQEQMIWLVLLPLVILPCLSYL